MFESEAGVMCKQAQRGGARCQGPLPSAPRPDMRGSGEPLSLLRWLSERECRATRTFGQTDTVIIRTYAIAAADNVSKNDSCLPL